MKGIRSKERLRVGVSIIKQLSTSFYPYARSIFDELIVNSRDAFATRVEISISESEVSIQDNGVGMSPVELLQFFYISHSDKTPGAIRSARGIRRKIIGKFGIGKLSTYRLCHEFTIISSKNGVEAEGHFDFDEFERHKFVDEILLNVKSRKKDCKSGTRIVMKHLKPDVLPETENLREQLSRTIPLTPDFEVFLNGQKIPPRDWGQANIYMVGEETEAGLKPVDVPGVGPVKGEIVYTKGSLKDDAGVYIRVFDRIVNTNPGDVFKLDNLIHAEGLSRRTYAVFDVDSLDEALLSNRSGFVKENPKYLAFLYWLKTTMNRYNHKEYLRWTAADKESKRTEARGFRVPEFLEKESPGLSRYSKVSAKRKLPFGKKKAGTDADSSELEKELNVLGSLGLVRNEKTEDNDIAAIRSEIGFDIDVRDLGSEERECVYDVKTKTFIINSAHPAYKISKNNKVFHAYHCAKAAIVLTAIMTTRTREEFAREYDRLMRKAFEKLFKEY